MSKRTTKQYKISFPNGDVQTFNSRREFTWAVCWCDDRGWGWAFRSTDRAAMTKKAATWIGKGVDAKVLPVVPA